MYFTIFILKLTISGGEDKFTFQKYISKQLFCGNSPKQTGAHVKPDKLNKGLLRQYLTYYAIIIIYIIPDPKQKLIE